MLPRFVRGNFFFENLFLSGSFLYNHNGKVFFIFLRYKFRQKGKAMREPIMKAVAMPPRLFWAPFLPAAANLAVQFPLMFIVMGIFDVNPILFMVSVIFGHIFIAIYGAREPHLSAMMRSYGKFIKGSQNIYKSKGMKLAP